MTYALQVVWSNPFGDIFLDSDIKLFEFEDVQKYSGYNDPPKSREFCRFYTSSSSKVIVLPGANNTKMKKE